MVMRNISEAKAELSKLVELAQNGEEVVIAKAGKAVIRLVLYAGPTSPRKPGSLLGKTASHRTSTACLMKWQRRSGFASETAPRHPHQSLVDEL